ncbi:beta-glucosidase [Anaerocolumna jejuensis DSM 15929]|uniref:beta-glucosidase n=1 Tax=Anaerocolumna jejuensis DSM 15929 TaxID=1121322 RepID=A0A1M7BUS6_9FIRM|nr:glycoside hydrolase family 3 N-terminal domain-containing protein [Anaerocolumna jejuensis]SHL58687.1 beta-glucosidase [Anaerocolumna jejuensis DSM 15929]
MKNYLLFMGKLFGILLSAAMLGYWVTRSIWGGITTAVLLILIYQGVYKLRQAARNRKWKNSDKYVSPLSKASDGFAYRDLNKNGKLDIYEDTRRTITERVEDLLSQMTIEEKAGLMFSPQMDVVNAKDVAKKGGKNFGGDVIKQIWINKINTFACMGSLPIKDFAEWHNAIQKAAECSRLGIPVTLCSDPRHVYVKQSNPLTTQKDDGITSWPSSLGFAASRDEELIENFGRIAAEELRAMGIRFALHPTADTATEPRWPRIYETFGEDAELNGRLAAAYIQGMQGHEINQESVACCIKHFPGGGPQKNGDDPHFAFGKEQIYPGGQFEYHLKPFQKVIDQGVAAVMPYYGVPVGLKGVPEVGFNFNRVITHDLLREKLGFKGIVHTDYSIIEGIKLFGITCIPGRAWGIEKSDVPERLIKALEAGVDQIGGECCSKKLAKLVRIGKLSEARLDESCRRILELKFKLGLFDNPYVDTKQAEKICCKPENIQSAEEAMRRSLVLLKKEKDGKVYLPIAGKPKVYTEGFDKRLINQYAVPVDRREDADIAIVWLEPPQRREPRDLMAMMFQSGDLDYTIKEKEHLQKIMSDCPTIVVIKLTRPAVIPEIKEGAAGIIAEFNAKPEIVLEALFGRFSPSGKLPFHLPGSMQATKKQKSDTPFDYEQVTYTFGHGLSY